MHSSNTSRPALLDERARKITRRLRSGGVSPSAEEYVARHPALGDHIRAVFASVVAAERPGCNPTLTSPPGPPRRRREYRLVSAAGRGGMGVVALPGCVVPQLPQGRA